MADTVPLFSKIAGGANCKGPMYEIKTAAMLYLRGLNSGRGFQLASNVKGAGALDDIVFRFKIADRWATMFLQLKHKEDLSAELKIKDFKKSPGAFSLVKYFESYLEISLAMKASGGQADNLFDGKIEDSMFVIFTNAIANEYLNVGRCVGNNPFIENYLGFGVGLVLYFDLDRDKDLVEILRCRWEELARDEKCMHREAIAQLDCNTEIGQFMERLRIFCGQPGESELDSIIVKELGEMKKCAGLSNKLVRLSECFIENVQKWSESNNSEILHGGSDIFLRARGKVIVETVSSVEEKAFLLDVIFEPSVLAEWKELIEKNCLTHVKSSESSSRLTCTKLVQAVGNSYMVLGLNTLMDNQESVLSECQHGEHKFIIIVLNDQTDSTCRDLVAKVCNVGIDSKKHLVILGHTADTKCRPSGENLPKWDLETDTFKLSQIGNKSRNRFLATKLQLQGLEVSLNQLIDGCSIDANEVLSASSFVEIVKSEKIISIGSSLISVVENYVARTLERAITVKWSIFEGIAESMAIINSTLDDIIRSMFMQSSTLSLSRNKIEETLKNYRKVDKITAANDDNISDGDTFHLGNFECNFLHLQKGPRYEALALRFRPIFNTPAQTTLLGWFIFVFKGIGEDHMKFLQKSQSSKHLLSYEGTELLWLKSNGQIEDIRKHVDENKLLLFDLSISSDDCDRLVLVCAEPGMGKTTLMAQIAAEVKTDLPYCWVIFLSLNDHTKLFATNKHNDAFEFLAGAGMIETRLQKALLRHVLDVTGNVVVILDGVDEIAPKYVEQCLLLISNLLKTKAKKILVTSRNSMKSKLEDHLKTLAVSIRKFNEDEQRRFLNMSWANISTMSAEELHEFITILLKKASRDLSDREQNFLGTPLQLVIMAQVFEDHVTDETGTYELPGILDLLFMMKEFINKKLWVFIQNKLKIDPDNNNFERSFELYRENLLESHAFAALFLIIDKENLDRLLNKRMYTRAQHFLQDIQSCKENTGIIDSFVNDKPRFIHRVFAEYFVATWFAEHFAESDEFLKDHLYEASFGGIRTFFDRLLAENSELHTAVLNENIDRVRELLEKVDVNSTDIGDRTALHLAASFAPSKDKVETARTCGILDLIIDSSPDFSLTDKVLNMSPLQYADITQSWPAINVLFPYYTADASSCLGKTLTNIDNKDMLKHITIHDLDKLFKFCMDHGLNVDFKELDKSGKHILLRILQNGSNRVYDAVNFKEDQLPDEKSLHHAARRGDLVAVERLIQNAEAPASSTPDRDDIEDSHVRDFLNVKDKYGHPPLYYAAIHGHVAVLSLLIKHGAEVDYEYERAGTPLYMAATLGKADVVRILVDAVTDKSAFIMASHKALMTAASCGHGHIITLLLEYLDEDEKAIFVRVGSTTGMSPLVAACTWGYVDVVQALLNAVDDADKPVYVTTSSPDGSNALCAASSQGHKKVVKMILDTFLQTEKSDYVKSALFNGCSALVAAVNGGHFEIVSSLLNAVNIVERADFIMAKFGDGLTTLHAGAAGGRREVLRVLLDELRELDDRLCSDFVMAQNNNGLTALMYATTYGNTEIVKDLLDSVDVAHRAKFIKTTDNFGRTALHGAANGGHRAVMRVLLETLSKLEGSITVFARAQNSKGVTALMNAAARGHTEFVRDLFTAVDVAEQSDFIMETTNDAMTALHAAATGGHREVVQVLLNYFCEPIDSQLSEFVRARSSNGSTALLLAATGGHTELVRDLIAAVNDADRAALVTSRIDSGETALHAAATGGHTEIARVLLDALGGTARSDFIVAQSNNGCSALMIAEMAGHDECVRFLQEGLNDVAKAAVVPVVQQD